MFPYFSGLSLVTCLHIKLMMRRTSVFLKIVPCSILKNKTPFFISTWNCRAMADIYLKKIPSIWILYKKKKRSRMGESTKLKALEIRSSTASTPDYWEKVVPKISRFCLNDIRNILGKNPFSFCNPPPYKLSWVFLLIWWCILELIDWWAFCADFLYNFISWIEGLAISCYV